MKQFTYLILPFCIMLSASSWSQTTVRGTVTASEGEPLIGVNILEAGTANGTVSDIDGTYAITVGSDASLVFSYTGFTTQTLSVDGRSEINIILEEGIGLEEVVVTALGISREKKSITYAAQNADVEDIREARPLNVVNGLSGKVAGISVARSGSGVGGASKVLLRGNRSIAGNSQPLYVVDGVTMGGGIENLSPDDIESITVLKGANAGAIYGNRANNGVIIVTTKMGRGQEGYAVDLNTTYMAASPIYLNDFQNEYGQGSGGVFNEHGERSWGPRLDGSQKPHWSNDPNWPATTSPYSANTEGKTSDFFQTGHNFATNLGISTRTENTRSYFSYTFTDAAGIIPGNALESHNISVRMNTKLLDRLTLDTKVNYIRTKRDNIVAQGGGYENPIRALYKMPANIQTEDVSAYEFIDNEGLNKQHFWRPGENHPSNPYWAINNITHDHLEERVIGLISLKYDITDDFSIMARSSIDRDNFHGTQRYSTDSYIIADNGFYRTRDDRGYEWNSDVLLNYQQDFTADLSLDVSAGANVRRNERGRITGNSGGRDSPLNVPNLFSFGNSSNITAAESFSTREVQSVYGFATVGWKDAIYLDVTARNDWSSTLKSDNRSFFYPSAGLTIVASDLWQDRPQWLSFLKLRGSYAEVGNDTGPFQTARAANISGGGTGGFLQLSTTIPIENLLPEKTTSTEVGADIRLFQNRLGIDFTYYKSNSTDQLFAVFVPIASGASNVFLNGADIENRGIEAVITGTIVETPKFSWDVTLNYANNESEVIEIAEGFDQLNIGGASFLAQFRLIEGQPWGDSYSRGFARDEQGRVIVEADGLPRVTPGLDVQVSNFNPDFLAGVRNSLSFGNFNFNFLIDIREGGTVVSNT
ncbi:MAG: SusC/RagA family TonB-linked outer membrane protein, partial [Saprospiraceae bacterium]|nr:SusC/RagA family TonB-linked outer membrane protein [Saprospiraceae bacterium]